MDRTSRQIVTNPFLKQGWVGCRSIDFQPKPLIPNTSKSRKSETCWPRTPKSDVSWRRDGKNTACGFADISIFFFVISIYISIISVKICNSQIGWYVLNNGYQWISMDTAPIGWYVLICLKHDFGWHHPMASHGIPHFQTHQIEDGQNHICPEVSSLAPHFS